MENDLENSDWKRDSPSVFKVPAGYFENLADRIQARVVIEDSREQIGNGGFMVPEKYFENLSSQIITKTRDKNPVKVIRLFQSNFFKYSAAACLILMCGVFLYINEPSPASKKLAFTGAETEQILFDIDEEVIIEHIQQHQEGEITTEVSDKELETYILNNFSHSDLSSE